MAAAAALACRPPSVGQRGRGRAWAGGLLPTLPEGSRALEKLHRVQAVSLLAPAPTTLFFQFSSPHRGSTLYELHTTVHVTGALHASGSSSLKRADRRVERGGSAPGAQVKRLVPVSRRPRSRLLCFVCCVAYLTQDPGNGRAQLWLTCPPAFPLRHLTTSPAGSRPEARLCFCRARGPRDATSTQWG